MASSVPNFEKKTFIRWFLKNYQLKRREGVWILNYLLTDESLLKIVHFVEDAHFCPRAIVMSSVDSNGTPFLYYKGNLTTSDAEKSFHDLRLNGEEDVYIQINFTNANLYMNYIAVLEENPHKPQDQIAIANDAHTAQKMLNDSLYQYQLERLHKQIDEALDAGNREQFIALTTMLKQLNAKEEKDGI